MAPRKKMPSKTFRPEVPGYRRKYTSPRIDIIFKRVFGTEKNKPILKEFLSTLLELEIIDLQLENSELPPLVESDGKSVRLDVLATVRTERGIRRVNIEVQNVAHLSLPQRAVYYGARIYAGQLQNSENYEQLNPAMVIFILNFPLFRGHERPVSIYELRESQTGAELVPGERPLEFMFIELPKVREKLDSARAELKQLDRWLLFLAARDDHTLEALKVKAKGSQLELALSEIEYAALSKKEKMLYDARIEGERIQRSILQENVAAAIAQGMAQGMAQGTALGEALGEARGEARGIAGGKVGILLRQASRRFGPLPADLAESLTELTNDQLDELADWILEAKDLEEFLKSIGSREKG
jgi:predicted transposase/invertase (TIGR01784 family)